MEKIDYQGAVILDGHHCGDCGWPIVFCCCNGGMSEQAPYGEWDWWYYCSNKTCRNHHPGAGVFQFKPEWAVRD